MSIEVAAELWSELKRYVNTVDRDEAAESVVSVLIDNDYDADDIRAAFKGDTDIKRALTNHLGNEAESEEVDEEVDDFDDDYDWEN
jgi:hypothetical protein